MTPFIKVGQQDLQVGYVGRDVEQIVEIYWNYIAMEEKKGKVKASWIKGGRKSFRCIGWRKASVAMKVLEKD